MEMSALGLRGKFTEEEDNQLRSAVSEYGTGDWRSVASRVPGRTVRQVKDRWNAYLREGMGARGWSVEEDRRMLELHREYGAKWVQISRGLPGRTDVMVKNRYNQMMRRLRRDLMVAESWL
jgi:hypothetical protein